MHSSEHHDNNHNVFHRVGERRPNSSSRTTPKPSSSYLKPADRHSSTSNTQPRYFLSLDKTKLPTFYNAQNTRLEFDEKELEIWINRLRILYQIDKGRNYGEIIDLIISILQFIPSNLLLPKISMTPETYPCDEIMLNDVARARMYVLEDWTADGDSHRLINLTESYRTMSPSALIIAQQQAAKEAKEAEVSNSNNSFQPSITTSEDFDEDTD